MYVLNTTIDLANIFNANILYKYSVEIFRAYIRSYRSTKSGHYTLSYFMNVTEYSAEMYLFYHFYRHLSR